MLGEHCVLSVWLQGLLVSSAVPVCPVCWELGQEVVVAGWSQWHACAWLWSPAAGVCVVSGAGCRHTRCGGSQSRQQGPGPMTGSLQLCDPGCPCVSPLGVFTTVEPSDVHQAGSLQMHSVCMAGGGSARWSTLVSGTQGPQRPGLAASAVPGLRLMRIGG